MKSIQYLWREKQGWQTCNPEQEENFVPNVLFVFGSSALLKDKQNIIGIKEKFKNAILFGCTTAGEIVNNSVYYDSIIVNACLFEKTEVKFNQVPINNRVDSFNAGSALASKFDQENLRYIFVLSDGLNVNGSELIRGLQSEFNENIPISGGLAGDGPNFNETFLFSEQGNVESKIITALGFYGDHIKIGNASFGGWDSFGIDRTVTKAIDDVLYEIDGQPALDLYKYFLGEEQSLNLPASGLLFPLSMRNDASARPVVRTVLAVDEASKSMTFAGEIPSGSVVRLMKANLDHLINGAITAANTLQNDYFNDETIDFALLISCVGRKMVLKQIVEEEIEGVSNILGAMINISGFYSYGEIAQFDKNSKCELHNQSMTITAFKELV